MTPEPSSGTISELYERRFSAADREAKDALWRVLCVDFFQRWVSPDSCLVDLGAGMCEFVNHIRARERWAVDSDPQLARRAAAGVKTHCGAAHDLGWLAASSVDVVFASNVFEHFRSTEDLLAALAEVRRVLRPGGRMLILQPNIRFAYREYWDYLDHHLPLSDRSMVEALELSGLRVEHVRPRFLPYTVKSHLPRSPLLLRVYLRCRPLHLVFGKQMFLVATRP